MMTGELKSKIDSLWEIFWTGGLTNPLDVIEQRTYLMFIHDLDEADNTRAKESAMLGLSHKSIVAGEVNIGDRSIPGNPLKWSVFRDFPAPNVRHRAGMGVPVYQNAPRRQVQRLRQVYGRCHFQNSHAVDAR